MSKRAGRTGLYVSFNEAANGDFSEAVTISKQAGGLIWLDKSRRDPERLNCPTVVFIRIKGQERYFRGVLSDFKLAESLPAKFALEQSAHRPSVWRTRDLISCPVPTIDFKSVLHIRSLEECVRPSEIGALPAPQGPFYVPL